MFRPRPATSTDANRSQRLTNPESDQWIPRLSQCVKDQFIKNTLKQTMWVCYSVRSRRLISGPLPPLCRAVFDWQVLGCWIRLTSNIWSLYLRTLTRTHTAAPGQRLFNPFNTLRGPRGGRGGVGGPCLYTSLHQGTAWNSTGVTLCWKNNMSLRPPGVLFSRTDELHVTGYIVICFLSPVFWTLFPIISNSALVSTSSWGKHLLH